MTSPTPLLSFPGARLAVMAFPSEPALAAYLAAEPCAVDCGRFPGLAHAPGQAVRLVAVYRDETAARAARADLYAARINAKRDYARAAQAKGRAVAEI